METDAIDYQAQQSLNVPQAITHTEKPRQTESSTIYHVPQQSIYDTQPPAIQYRQTHGIENMETDAIDYQAKQP